MSHGPFIEILNHALSLPMEDIDKAVQAAADRAVMAPPLAKPRAKRITITSPPLLEDEQALKAFRERCGANKTPEEHRAEWLAAHGSECDILMPVF